MQIIATLAQKGGIGKTTLTVHFAVEAVRRGLHVAVIDADSQRSASKWAERRAAEAEKKHGNDRDAALSAAAEPAVVKAQPAGDTPLPALVKLCREDKRQLVFVDTMPRVELNALEVAKLATFALLPAAPHIVDIEALEPTVELVARAKLRACIVLNNCRPGSRVNDDAVKVLEGYGLPICPIHIFRRASLADAFNDGRAVAELEPNGKGAKEIADAWRWITKQMERST